MRRLVAGILLCAALVWGQWPQFRGPNGTGVSTTSSRLPVHFGPETGVAWRTELPIGHSSPVITGDRIFVTGARHGRKRDAGRKKIVDEGGQLYTICLDRSNGEILWMREAPRPRLERYQPTNSPASPSAVTDGDRVIVFFGDFGLLAYDLEGTELWRLPLGPFNNVNGHGSSPILVDDLVILLCDQDSGSYLIAVDSESGKVKWKTDRPEVTRSYSTPGIFQPAHGPTEVLVPGAYQLASYDADTGKKLWWIGGLSWQPKSIPVVVDDILYAHWWESGGESSTHTKITEFTELLAKHDSNSDGKLSPEELAAEPEFQRGIAELDLASDGFLHRQDWDNHRARKASRNALLAVRLNGARGDLTGSANIIWRMQKFLPNVPSPLVYQDVVYLIKNGGILSSVDRKTGRILKQGRLPGAVETYYASPVGGAGLIYAISETGKMTVLKAGGQWEVLSSIDFEEDTYATPAIVGDSLYVRTTQAMYCFRARGATP